MTPVLEIGTRITYYGIGIATVFALDSSHVGLSYQSRHGGMGRVVVGRSGIKASQVVQEQKERKQLVLF